MFLGEKGKQFENKLCILLHTVIEESFSTVLNITLYYCKLDVKDKEKSRNRALHTSVIYAQNRIGRCPLAPSDQLQGKQQIISGWKTEDISPLSLPEGTVMGGSIV